MILQLACWRLKKSTALHSHGLNFHSRIALHFMSTGKGTGNPCAGLLRKGDGSSRAGVAIVAYQHYVELVYIRRGLRSRKNAQKMDTAKWNEENAGEVELRRQERIRNEGAVDPGTNASHRRATTHTITSGSEAAKQLHQKFQLDETGSCTDFALLMRKQHENTELTARILRALEERGILVSGKAACDYLMERKAAVEHVRLSPDETDADRLRGSLYFISSQGVTRNDRPVGGHYAH